MSDLRVFLSHTSDLDAPVNRAVDFVGTAIRVIAAQPGFSLEEQGTTFTAEDQPAADVCRRRLAGCDIYVGIIGYGRGSTVRDDPMRRSFVEFEFDVARELGLPRIVLVWNDLGHASGIAVEQSTFRMRLTSSQEVVFAGFSSVGDLRLALVEALVRFRPETSEHVSCHIEWARPAELASLGIDPTARRWAVYVRNAGEYPAYDVLATVHSNNGREDWDIDMGTIAPRDVTSTPYVLNLEIGSFNPDGERPLVELFFTVTGVRWHRRRDGSLVRTRSPTH